MRIVAWNELRYVPDPGITGFEMAPVLDDAAGCVKCWRIPAGWGLGALGIEENLHFHRRAWEYAAILDGDFPHVEWDDAAHEKRRIRFRPGQLMIRPPTSIHGLHADMTVLGGCDILYWNTGSGTSVLDRDYPDETVDVQGDPSAHPFDPANRCRIESVDDAPGPAARVPPQAFSRPGEPCGVVLHRVAAGTDVALADVCGDDLRFLFQWRGRTRIDAAPGGGRLGHRSFVLRDAGPLGGRLHAETGATWLVVHGAR